MIVTKSAVKLTDGIYWVGSAAHNASLNCNPYLLVDGEEAVLFDPGSGLDFAQVYENVTQIVSIDKIKYIVLHHQDPDLCASVPLFEQAGAAARLVTHWRTSMLVQYYGVRSPYYIVNEHHFQLTLGSGRVLNFLPTPYLHFPGAIATYDPQSKILFSSDLFGALSLQDRPWSLLADEDYLERMKTFHEHYMPANEILRPVMESFLKLDIAMIAPQHGSVINQNVRDFIVALRDLRCGLFLNPVRHRLREREVDLELGSQVLHRYAAIFGRSAVLDAIADLPLQIDEASLTIHGLYQPVLAEEPESVPPPAAQAGQAEMSAAVMASAMQPGQAEKGEAAPALLVQPEWQAADSVTGHRLWNVLFERIAARKGLSWLLVIEPFVSQLSADYELAMPAIFTSSLHTAQVLRQEVRLLKRENEALADHLQASQERLVRDKITGLYNFDFFKLYLQSTLANAPEETDITMILINMDQMARIRFEYGDAVVDETLQITAGLIDDLKSEQMVLFRLQGAAFAVLDPDGTKQAAVVFAEHVRNAIAFSGRYIERMTVSIGVVSRQETFTIAGDDQPGEKMYRLGISRVSRCRKMGQNMVCSGSEMNEDDIEVAGRILIADTDEVSLDVLTTALGILNYQIFTARDGESALKLAQQETPDCIISEITLPKVDGFLVREQLLQSSETKNIPFLLISYLKDDYSVRRALSLGIEHYFKKPFMLTELVGLINLKLGSGVHVNEH